MVRNLLYSLVGFENEEFIDISILFEILGLFFEIEGIISQINVLFDGENQFIFVEVLFDEEVVDILVGEFIFILIISLDIEEDEVIFIDVCDYIELLNCFEFFVDLEQRRREVENEDFDI